MFERQTAGAASGTISRRKWLAATGGGGAAALAAGWLRRAEWSLLADEPGPAADAKKEKEQDQPEEIGGQWRFTAGDPAVYSWQDHDRLTPLFLRQHEDHNRDGIPDLRATHDKDFLFLRSQGYPNHKTAVYPNASNPNTIRAQDFYFRLPLRPKQAESITRLPMGPIGVAINGVVFFNPFEAGGMNAVDGYSEVWLDSCCGHPQQHGVYHYHKYPTCVRSPFRDDGSRHSTIIGFAWDGFPLFGPYESDGRMAKDLEGEHALDVCNGHSDPQRGYHYHVTPGKFPYIIGGYAGVPETANNHLLRRPQTGAIEDNASGEPIVGKTILTVTPGNAARGRTHRVRLELDLELAARWHVPPVAPQWAQVGPFEGQRITRRGNVVEFDLPLPEDADSNVMHDCHLEFASPLPRGWPIVLKKNDALRVIDG